MKYLYYLISHFEDWHWSLQLIAYCAGIALCIAVLLIGHGKYF